MVWWFGDCKISAIQYKRNIFKYGVEWRGIGKCAIFDGKLAVYLRNSKRLSQGSYCALTGSRMSFSHDTKIICWPIPTSTYGRPSLARTGLLYI